MASVGAGARRKGATAEREVAALLAAWWTSDNDPKVKFKRTPLSGGWGGAEGFDVAGDVITNSRTFPFCVEVKFREGFELDNVLKGRRSPVWKWWAQACADAKKTKRQPLLFFRKSPAPFEKTEWYVLAPDTNAMLMPTPFNRYSTNPAPGCAKPLVYRAEDFLRSPNANFARPPRG